MNKTDRLLAIILELQRKGRQRATDLATTFETSKRTIYRDIHTLGEANVPIIGVPGQGYTLMEGGLLPPVCFTTEEAITLTLGLDFVEHQFDTNYREKAHAARLKIEAILPALIREETPRVRQGLQLETLATLRRAVLEERKVHFHYKKEKAESHGDRHSNRTVDPYALVYVNGTWALIAFCTLRNHIRHFRLGRMTELKLVEEKFVRPPDFQLRPFKPIPNRSIVVRLLLDSVEEQYWKINTYSYTESIIRSGNSLLVTLRVNHIEDILSWVLSFGASARVLEPNTLQQLICDNAENVLLRY